MIEVFDTEAARILLARRKLACPHCRAALRPWGHARVRVVRELGGGERPVRPDRARCTGCAATHVVLPAAMLPRRAYTADVIGQALVSAARGHGHRTIARRLAVPDATVRGWIRRARSRAPHLWQLGVQSVVALDQDALPTLDRPSTLACAIDALAAAATALGRRFDLADTSPWERVTVVTHGRLLAPAPAT